MIKNGTIITSSEVVGVSVLIDGESILALVSPTTELATQFEAGADRVIDAAGRYVIPGGIDAHTHLESPGQNITVSDTFETGTQAAVWGGTTAIIDFARQTKGTSIRGGFEEWLAKTESRCAVDYGFHMIISDVNDETPKDMDILVGEGVTSFKMFMAYPGRVYLNDGEIFRMMQRAGHNGGLIMMHAENGVAIDILAREAIAQGNTAPVYHAFTRPAIWEGEAVNRAVKLAAIARVPVYIVHVSCGEALQEVVDARDTGQSVFAETCPQYLFLSVEDLKRPNFEGSRYVCSPPLRPKGHQADLWRGLAMNDLQVVATDHSPFTWSQKKLGLDDFRNIPNGIPGIEHRMDLIFQGSVAERRLSLNRWVEITSTAPARMFGLYPKKGTIAPGSDADIVIYNPEAPHAISVESHHMNVDYSCYEGFEVRGKVETVLIRGKVVLEKDRYVGQGSEGRFMRRGLCQFHVDT